MNDLHSKMTLLYHHVMMILIQCYTCWFWVRWLLNVLYSWIFVPHINIAITLPPLTNILLDINLGYKFFFEGFILYFIWLQLAFKYWISHNFQKCILIFTYILQIVLRGKYYLDSILKILSWFQFSQYLECIFIAISFIHNPDQYDHVRTLIQIIDLIWIFESWCCCFPIHNTLFHEKQLNVRTLK